MILVKTKRTNNKCKVRKFDLVTEFVPEDIQLIDDSKIECRQLYKMANEKIETLNRRLEKCRLIMRAIECSFNNSNLINEKSDQFENLTKIRTKGKFYKSLDSDNGIFIH